MQLIKPKIYQEKAIREIYSKWNNNLRNVGFILPTGGGKTFTMGFIAKEFNSRNQYVVLLAHRNILVSQISLSLAKLGLTHNLLCSNSTEKFIRNLHVEKLGHCYVSESSKVLVTGVHTIVRRDITKWASKVGLWMMDEGHHLLRSNVWGRAIEPMANAYGLSVTATFCRLDRKGLGRCADGVVDDIVLGPDMRRLIDSGDLCNYRIVSTPLSESIHSDLQSVRLVGNDYETKASKLLTSTSAVMGNAVETYKKFANGKRGITFCVDIEQAEQYAKAFRNSGVPAIALSAKTPEGERWEALRKHETGEYLQLVNCQLFGEGFDLPVCESASFIAPTKSYGKYVQEFGRPLRTSPGKTHAWIFDHVGNVAEHKLPDYGLDWSLERGSVRQNDTQSDLKITRCINPDCFSLYTLPASKCPWCEFPYGSKVIKENGEHTYVDADLRELTEEELKQLQRKKEQAIAAPEKLAKQLKNAGIRGLKYNSMVAQRRKRYEAQIKLRDSMTRWAKCARLHGLEPNAAKKQFKELFEVDPDEAQTLNISESRLLQERIDKTSF